MTSETGISKSAEFTLADTGVCKGIAVLMMLFHHLFNEYSEYAGHYVNYWPLSGDQVISLGLACKVCVAIFVFISGFGLASSYAHAFGDDVPSAWDSARFSLVRWWKLMTSFWPVYALAVLCGPLGRDAVAVYGGGVRNVFMYGVIDAFGLADGFHTPTLNPTWWYMTLAIAFIFLVPLVMRLVRALGPSATLAAGVLLTALLGLGELPFGSYVASFLLGVFCRERGVLEAWGAWHAESVWGVLKTLLSGVLLSGAFLMRNQYGLMGVTDALYALFLCMFVMAALRSVPVVTRTLALCGRHSTNMFLVHTLLYSYYFLGFYYSFQIPLLILAVLAATSILVSVVLEWLKGVTGYRTAMQRAGEVVTGHILGRQKPTP